jgi:RimJ/RimL family protein N-acetyltransferase
MELLKAGIMIVYKKYWNKGYGTEAMRLLLDFAFN